jgi:hypothetical protein
MDTNMLKLTNENYCATVVALTEFIPLPGCDKIKHAKILNSLVIVSSDAKPGDVGLYFPVETKIADWFLRTNNLYSSPEKNENVHKKGYFGNAGRIRAVKLRGFISDGFFAPIQYLTNEVENYPLGSKFNEIDDLVLCEKYEPKKNSSNAGGAKKSKRAAQIVDNQFYLHDDTANLRRNIQYIWPWSIISITEKYHGCNAVIGKILCNKKESLIKRTLNILGITSPEKEYKLVWSSRNVIKGVGEEEFESNHFYGSDVWGKCANEIKDRIPNGVLLYGEIIGWAGEKPIQKGYTYSQPLGTAKFLCFGVRFVNPDGLIYDLNAKQVEDFCSKYNIPAFSPLFHGRAEELFPFTGEHEDTWQTEFLEFLEKEFATNEMCALNNFAVPEEGIVLSEEFIHGRKYYKLKNWNFLEWETKQLDQEVVSIEDEN